MASKVIDCSSRACENDGICRPSTVSFVSSIYFLSPNVSSVSFKEVIVKWGLISQIGPISVMSVLRVCLHEIQFREMTHDTVHLSLNLPFKSRLPYADNGSVKCRT